MDLKPLEEKIAFLQRHVEQQDRAMLELTREVARISERLARAEARLQQQAGGEDSGPPADERPPHW
ncbi:MAG: SlyX family protein [Verrucomicrobiota bacterium]|jgi:SlyX protein